MSEHPPFGTAPPETLILKVGAETQEVEMTVFLEDVRALLPHLNWRAHIFIVEEKPTKGKEHAAAIIHMAAQYLTEQPLATLYIHPFLFTPPLGSGAFEEWEDLLSPVHPFQEEAYERQGEVRLIVLPIIDIPPSFPEQQLPAIAGFFRERFSKPSFYFHGAPPLDPETIERNDLRVYVAKSSAASAVMEQLRINQAFERVLEWIEGGSSTPLAPCGRLLIIDQETGLRFPCFARWERGQPGDTLGAEAFRDCLECMASSCLEMKENIEANGRVSEGRQAAMALASALSREGKWAEGAAQAHRASEYARLPAEKAAALLHEGLCLSKLGRRDEAEAVFKEGAGNSPDPGPFDYHLGTIAFARGEFAEAGHRFERALASGSPDVPPDDARFNLALSSINQGQFQKARFHLDRMEKPSVPVWFYRGICDLGENKLEAALANFREALAGGPAPEDLSRVHFYIATCLKDMGRYDEAIAALERAIEADPEEYLNYNLLGFCYYQQRRFEEAIKALHRAIERNPLSAIDYASIGSSLRELGRMEDAVAMYAMALSLDPDLAFARENLSRLKALLMEKDKGAK